MEMNTSVAWEGCSLGTWKILHPGTRWASQSRDCIKLPASSPRFGNEDAGPADIQPASGRDLKKKLILGFGVVSDRPDCRCEMR